MSSHLINVLVISISFVMMMVAVGLTYKVYLTKKFSELRNISAGFFMTMAVPTSFGLALYLQDPSFETIRTVIGIHGLIISGIGAYIMFRNILSLRGEDLVGYQKILPPLFFFGLGFLSLNLNWTWVNDSWVAVYSPPWGIFIVGIPTAWVTFELAKLSFKNYSQGDRSGSALFLNTIGFSFIFISVVVLMVERILYPGSTLYFIAVLALGTMIISISLVLDPYVLIPNIIGGKSLIISDKQSGGSLVEYHFQQKVTSEIFPGAMTGILGMLAELTGKKELPPELGYVNLRIVIEEIDGLVAYLIVEQTIHPLRQVLKEILDLTKSHLKRNYEIEESNVKMIKQTISAKFDFIH